MLIDLVLVNGERIQHSVNQETFTIGRSPKCDIVVPHEGMSRIHCQVDITGGEVFVTDLGSTNGVMINGEKIAPHVKTPYLTYFTLSFGAVQSLEISTERKSHSVIDSLNKRGSKSGSRSNKNETKEGKKNSTSPKETIQSNSDKFEKNKRIALNIFTFTLIAAMIFLFLQMNNDQDQSSGSNDFEEYKSYEAN